MTIERYAPPPRRPPGDSDAWDEAAVTVLRSMLEAHHALTVAEMEARGSDRTWDATVWPWPINPHHFTNARSILAYRGEIEPTMAPTRSHPEPITTWSLARARGRGRLIDSAAGRKRLLTARHAGWALRGGAGHGLIGRAGENAVHAAMTDPSSQLTHVSGSTSHVLGVQLPGEIDNSAFYVDTSTGSPVAITVLVEVKNTRSWYYADDVAVRDFLAKAAHLQLERPDALILPIFICRQFQFKLWELGKAHGLLPAKVIQQLVLPDSDLDQDVMNEVAYGLGYEDLRLGDAPTNRHRGIFVTSVPRHALEYAERWREHYELYLPEGRNARL